MKLKPCPWCGDTPAPVDPVTHLCRVLETELVVRAVSWNRRFKRLPVPPFEAEQPELPLAHQRSVKQLERDRLLCTLASIETGVNVDRLTSPEARRHAAALKIIQAFSPQVTAEELVRRGLNYQTHFDQPPTSNALAKWWRKSEWPKSVGRPQMSEINQLAARHGLAPTR